jgi:magnesium-transporting ATPase (P-type)
VAKTWKIKAKKAGEPAKLTPENMVFSGCSITSGNGKGITIATGMNTRIGQIAVSIEGGDKSAGKKKCFCLPDTSGSETPLQQDLGRLGKNIGIIAIVVCVVIFIIGTALNRKDPSNKEAPAAIYMILIAVTLAVAAIPEGIPLCVTISLSIGCKQMIEQDVLVRKLPAVETLGSSSIICSDKTGTLTEGKMRGVHMWTAGAKYNISGKGFVPEGLVENTEYPGKDAKGDMGVRSTLLAGMLCCNATVLYEQDEKTKEWSWNPYGNSSEAPIIVAGMKVGFENEKAKKVYERVLEVPFSSSRKMMLTMSEVRGSHFCENGAELAEGTQYMVVCKGAPNYIIKLCTHQLMADGKQQSMTQSMKDKLEEIVDDYSSQALRVLAIAACGFKQLPFDKTNDEITIDQKFNDCTQTLCLYGLFASMDPHRDGVPKAIADARGAGIRVVMITGDYLKTAIAIAKNKSDNEG